MRRPEKQHLIIQLNRLSKPWSAYLHLLAQSRSCDGMPPLASLEGIRSLLAQKLETESYNQHIFVRKEQIQSPRDARAILRTQELITPLYVDGKPTGISVEAYLKDLIAYEKSASARSGHAGRFTILDSFTVMLPINCSRLFFRDFADSIVRDTRGGSQLPHFATYWKCGKGSFLTVYFSARKYYPEGKTTEIKAPADQYRTASGKLCRADAEGAMLTVHKGDILRTETITFEKSKSDLFRMSYKGFKTTIMRMKKHIAKLISDIGQAPAYILPRFSGNSFRYRRMKKGCAHLNQILAYWEEKLNTIYDHVRKIWDPAILQKHINRFMHGLYACLFQISGGAIPASGGQHLYMSFDYCSQWHHIGADTLNWYLETAINGCFADAQEEAAGIFRC